MGIVTCPLEVILLVYRVIISYLLTYILARKAEIRVSLARWQLRTGGSLDDQQ